MLNSFKSTGSARVPMGNGSSAVLSPHAQREVIEQVALELYPHEPYGRALVKLQRDPRAAAKLREATAQYCAAAPAAPAAPAALSALARANRRMRVGYNV